MRRRDSDSITHVGGTTAARPITSIQEPTKYELIIDHTIAKTLGLRWRDRVDKLYAHYPAPTLRRPEA